MAPVVDVEWLISLVEERPVLWDRNIAVYKSRVKTEEAWKEICKTLKNDFDALPQKAQNDYTRHVVRKWTNIRDSYRRHLRNMRNAPPGSAHRKKYLYFNELNFLKSVCTFDDEPSELGETNSFDESNEVFIGELINEPESSYQEEISYPTNLSPKRKPEYSDPLERRTATIQESSQSSRTSRHMSFFAGITPALESLNEDQILEFQIEVLKLIKSIKNGGSVEERNVNVISNITVKPQIK